MKIDMNTPSVAPADIMAYKLQVSPFTEIESDEGATLTICHSETGARCRVSRRLYEVMKTLKRPSWIRDVLSPELQAYLTPHFQQLMAAGFLIGQGLPSSGRRKVLKPVSCTLFRSPARSLSDRRSDVAVVGVPFDSGNLIGPGARLAPERIRLNSWQYPYRVDFHSGRPAGWYDIESQKIVLDGISISDWGDLRSPAAEPPAALFEDLETVACEMVDHGTFPVMLGGDHSVSYPLVKAIQRSRPITVIWFDAHLDTARLDPGGCPTHKNVVTRIRALPNVAEVIHAGYRGYDSADVARFVSSAQNIFTAGRLRHEGVDSLISFIPPTFDCYISIDIDVVDPSWAPGTMTPVPCGLDPRELKTMLAKIGQQRRIAGIDIVEVNPSRDREDLTSLLACDILLAGLAASFRHRCELVQ